MPSHAKDCTKKLRPVFSPQTDPLKGHHLPKRPTQAASPPDLIGVKATGNVRFEQVHTAKDEEWEIRYEHDLNTWMSAEDKDGKVVEGLRNLFDLRDDNIPTGQSISDLSSSQLAKLNQSLAQPRLGGAYVSALQKEEELLGVPFASSDLPTFMHEGGDEAVKKLVASRLQWWQTEMEGETRPIAKELAGLQRYLSHLPQGGSQWRMVAHTTVDSDNELPEDDDDLLGPGIEKFFITTPQIPKPPLEDPCPPPAVAVAPVPDAGGPPAPDANALAAAALHRQLDVAGRLLEFREERQVDAERYVQALKRRIWKLRWRLGHPAGGPGAERRREDEVAQLRAEREWLYAKLYALQNQNMQTVEDYVEKVKEHAQLRIRTAHEEGEAQLKAQKGETQQAREDNHKSRAQLREAREQAARWKSVAQGLVARLPSYEAAAMQQAELVAVCSDLAALHSPPPAYTAAPEEFFTDLRTRAGMERDLDVVRFMPFLPTATVTLQSPFRHSFGDVREDVQALWLGFLEKLDLLLSIVGAGRPIDFPSQVGTLKARLQDTLAAVATRLLSLQQNCQKVIDEEVEAHLEGKVRDALEALKAETTDAEAQTDEEELAPRSDLSPSGAGGGQDTEAPTEAARRGSFGSQPGDPFGTPGLESSLSFVSGMSEVVEDDPVVHHERRRLERQVDEFSAALGEALQVGIAADDELARVSDLLRDFRRVMGSVPPTPPAVPLAERGREAPERTDGQPGFTSPLSSPHGSVPRAARPGRPPPASTGGTPPPARGRWGTFTHNAVPDSSPASPSSMTSGRPSIRSTRSRFGALRARRGLGAAQEEIMGQISGSVNTALFAISGGVLGSALAETAAPAAGERESPPHQLGQLRDTVMQLSTCLKLKAAAVRTGDPSPLLPDTPPPPPPPPDSTPCTANADPQGLLLPEQHTPKVSPRPDLPPTAAPSTTCDVGTMTIDLPDPGPPPSSPSARLSGLASPRSPRARSPSPTHAQPPPPMAFWSQAVSRPPTGRQAVAAALTDAQMRLIQSLGDYGAARGRLGASPLACRGTTIGSGHRADAGQADTAGSQNATWGTPAPVDELDTGGLEADGTEGSRALLEALHGRDPLAARASRPMKCASHLRPSSALRPKGMPSLKLKPPAPADEAMKEVAGDPSEAGNTEGGGSSRPSTSHRRPTTGAVRSPAREGNAALALRSPSASAAPRRPPPPPAPLSPAALPLVAGPAAAAAAGAGPVSRQWLALHRALFRLLGLLRHAFSIPIAVEEPISSVYLVATFDRKAGLLGEPEGSSDATAPDASTSLGVLQQLLAHDTQLVHAFHAYIEDVLGLTQRLQYGAKLLVPGLEEQDGDGPDREARLASAALAQEAHAVYLFRGGPTPSPSPFPTPELGSHSPRDNSTFKRAMAHIQRYEERRTVLPLLKRPPYGALTAADAPEDRPRPASRPASPPPHPPPAAAGEERSRPLTTVEMAAAIQRSLGSFL